jgi:hypothetical protein
MITSLDEFLKVFNSFLYCFKQAPESKKAPQVKLLTLGAS